MSAPAPTLDRHEPMTQAELRRLYELLRKAQNDAGSWPNDAAWYALGGSALCVHERWMSLEFPERRESAPVAS